MTDRAIRVALVEDDKGIRETLAELLKVSDGFSFCGMFADGESAVEQLPKLDTDVALVDINLPGISGIDVIMTLHATCPNLQFLVLTVYDDNDKIFRALAAGAGGYLLKREAPSKLLESIRDIQRGGAPMSASIARQVVQSFHKMGARQEPSENLSPREEEILKMLAEGDLYKEIAEKLGIHLETVKTHIKRIYEKLHVRSRTEAVVKHLLRNNA